MPPAFLCLRSPAAAQGLDKGTKAFGLSEELKTGVLFLTYSSLISNVGGRSRLQQVRAQGAAFLRPLSLQGGQR